jgi:hypothetical protein
LTNGLDIPFQRTTTITQLYEKISEIFPNLMEEPPLFISTETNLKDDDIASIDENADLSSNNKLQSITEKKEGRNFISNLEKRVSDYPPQSRYISIAKAFSSGPPLTLKSALKLKWNDIGVLQQPNQTIDHPPMNLRDGSVLLVRSTADFERAKSAAKKRKENDIKSSTSPTRAGGNGLSAVRAKTASLGSRSTNSLLLKQSAEKGLKIDMNFE